MSTLQVQLICPKNLRRQNRFPLQCEKSSRTGEDVTEAFRRGAEKTLETAEKHGAALALLKERSPSCGFGAVYDGTFTGTVGPGDGVAAELLAKNGVAVYGESRVRELLERT